MVPQLFILGLAATWAMLTDFEGAPFTKTRLSFSSRSSGEASRIFPAQSSRLFFASSAASLTAPPPPVDSPPTVGNAAVGPVAVSGARAYPSSPATPGRSAGNLAQRRQLPLPP